MNALFRARLPVEMLAGMEKVCAEIGTSPQEVLRMLCAEMIRRRALPFVPGDGWDGMVPRKQADETLESFFGPDDDQN